MGGGVNEDTNPAMERSNGAVEPSNLGVAAPIWIFC